MSAPDEAELARFVALFDAQRYDEAHEVLDGLWLATHGPDEGFYKGLIQAAICLHHFQRGNGEGARKLYSGQRRYLAPYLPAHRGLDLDAFLADMQGFLRAVVRPEPGVVPHFEAALAPRLGRP